MSSFAIGQGRIYDQISPGSLVQKLTKIFLHNYSYVNVKAYRIFTNLGL